MEKSFDLRRSLVDAVDRSGTLQPRRAHDERPGQRRAQALKGALIAFAAATLASASACGPSNSDVKLARESTYNIDYATMWKAVDDEVKERFDKSIESEDAEHGYIRTGWKKIEATKDYDPNRAGADSAFGAQLFRLKIRIVGGPPWRLDVDGEAARYTQNMSTLYPWKHGDPDEPEWVPGRTDAFYVAVYQRLKQYATKAPAGAPASAPAPEPNPAPAPAPAPTPTPAP